MGMDANGIIENLDTTTRNDYSNPEARAKVERLIENEVYTNVTSLVEYILRQDDSAAPFDSSDVENEYRSFDWRDDTAALMRYVSDEGIDIDDTLETMHDAILADDANEYDKDALGEMTLADLWDHASSALSVETMYAVQTAIEYIEQAANDHANDSPAEVYEWYAVSSWLAARLATIGEVVIQGYNSYWGRQCTGQRISMDLTFYEILP